MLEFKKEKKAICLIDKVSGRFSGVEAWAIYHFMF